jgi:hypothetical protein
MSLKGESLQGRLFVTSVGGTYVIWKKVGPEGFASILTVRIEQSNSSRLCFGLMAANSKVSHLS